MRIAVPRDHEGLHDFELPKPSSAPILQMSGLLCIWAGATCYTTAEPVENRKDNECFLDDHEVMPLAKVWAMSP